MKIEENVLLAPYTTFKIGGPARYFCTINNDRDLLEAVEFVKNHNLRFFVLGGGSNLLVSDNGFNGLVIKNEYPGIEIKEEQVSAGAGVVWDTFVGEMINKGFYGLENLTSIPGTVGAAAVQNIGAYGVDVSETIDKVKVLDLQDMQFKELKNKDCEYAYRDSIFKKTKYKQRYIVTHVYFNLSKTGEIKADYKDIKDYLLLNNISKATPSMIREIVSDIRNKKLPDWKKYGTAGSFFKNPIISKDRFEELKKKYPQIPSYREDKAGKYMKVSLAWILDKICDAKEMKTKSVSVYENQALVFVARSGASANEVIDFSREIMKKVYDMTGIKIETEVEWVN